ncbi:DUF2975 domain-containing protein [Phocaeicola sp.]
MNKVRILGIIAIIAIIASFIGSFTEGWNSFGEGMDEGFSSASAMHEPGRKIIPNNAFKASLNVKPSAGTAIDSLNNNRIDWPIPYEVREIQTYAKPSAWILLFMGLAIPASLAFLYGFYNLVRMLISISRREVFTHKNVWRLRWFAYTTTSVEFLISITDTIIGHAAIKQISLPGYDIISPAGYSAEWTYILVIVLFAEIFAAGVKIKEEQDLTI